MLGLKLIHISKKGALDRFLIMDLALRQNAYLLSYDQAAFSKDVYRRILIGIQTFSFKKMHFKTSSAK